MSPVINLPDLHGVAQVAAARMLDGLAQGAVITALVAILLRALRRHSSGVRFIVWFSVLVAVSVLPFIGWLVSPRELGELPSRIPVRAAVTLPASWALYLFVAWSVIAALAVAQVAVGWWRLRRLRQACFPIDTRALPPALHETLVRFRPARTVQICTSERVQAPTAMGFFRPAIVIPAWLLGELSADDLRHVLLHELAHIRRWDDWTNLAQKLIRALFFFHPVVWWIERRISLEREMACDDAVVAATANPRAYAECLAFLAEKAFMRRSLELVQAAVSRMRQTSARVAKILSQRSPISASSWRPAVPLLAVLSLACFVLIGRMPDLVTFADPGATLAAVPNQQNAPRTPAVTAAAHHATPRPAMARASAVKPRAELSASSQRVRSVAMPVRAVRKPVVTLASSRVVSRVNRPPSAAGFETVVVFVEERSHSAQGMAWQIQVWHVTLLRQLDTADRKAI